MIRPFALGLAAAALLVAAGCSTAPTGAGPRKVASPAEVRPSRSGDETVCSRVSANPGAVLRVVVLRGVVDEGLCQLVRSRAGDALDESVAEEDLARLFATQRFDDVAVVVESTQPGEALAFELTPRPMLEDVVVRGVPGLDASDQRALLGERPGVLMPVWVRAIAASIARELERRGHPLAVVEHRVVPGDRGGVVLHFDAEPGARFVLRELRIEGTTVLRPADFLPALRMVRGEPIDGDLLERDRLAVVAVLFDQGFIEGGATTDRRIDPEHAAIDVVIHVSEGARHRLGSVRIEATMKLPEARYAPALERLRKGAWFHRSDVMAAVAAIEAAHRDAGVPKRVRPEVTLRGRDVDVTLVLEDP